eukprot:EG_transcript_3191
MGMDSALQEPTQGGTACDDGTANPDAGAAAPVGRGLASHSTVRLCHYTLQFETKELEDRYRAHSRLRWRRLLLRSLLPSAGFQLLFCLTDYTMFPADNLRITLPARLLLIVMQLCLFFLAKLNLVETRQRLILGTTVVYGLTSLTLFGLQQEHLTQLDGLYVVFGLAFYCVPKVSPLSFLSSFVGGWAAVLWYVLLAVYARPPLALWDIPLALSYVVPAVVVFNVVMYYYECSARERFVLRDRLSQEHITVAVARTFSSAPSGSRDRTVLLGMVLWLLLTAVGWTSIHDFLLEHLKVESDTAWAWFSHCAGLSVFMLMVTRQTRWLFVFPIIGALVLWGMLQAIPEPWIILSAHGVGYSLLALAAVITLGAFGHFMAAWRQLIGFLQRSCLLYPQLQAGLQKDFPLLEMIVRDYNDGLNPKSSKVREDLTSKLCSKGAQDRPSGKEGPDTLTSVLMTPKPEMCFFCGKAGAVHFVPCCSAWGPYAQWRMELSQDAGRAQCGLKAALPPPVEMCTPYSALQLKLKQTEVELQLSLWERQQLERKLAQAKASAAQANAALLDTQAKAAQTTQALQQQTADLDREWQRRLDCLAAECLAALGDGPEAQHCLRQRLAAAGLPLSEGGRRGV